MKLSSGKLNERRGERGSVMVVSGIGMLSLFLAAGLAIDISHLYTAKAEVQNAADAAALAAASQINSKPGGIRLAVAEATKAMNKYDFSTSVAPAAADITFGVNLNGTYVNQASAETNAANIRFVKVAIPPKPVKVTFAALVISSTQNIGATAVAGLSVGLTMNKFNEAFAFVEPNTTPLAKGQTYTLGAKSWNVNTPTSYRILEGPGGDDILYGDIHAYDYPVTTYTAQKILDTDACRKARIGINARFDDYTPHPGGNRTVAPPDTITQENITYDQYRDLQANGPLNVQPSAGGVTNRRIITLPVTKSSSYNTTTASLVSNKIAAFFVKRKIASATCTLEVEYIGERLAMPVGEYQPGNVQATEFAIPVLYK